MNFSKTVAVKLVSSLPNKNQTFSIKRMPSLSILSFRHLSRRARKFMLIVAVTSYSKFSIRMKKQKLEIVIIIVPVAVKFNRKKPICRVCFHKDILMALTF